jgi:hypothetical protein
VNGNRVIVSTITTCACLWRGLILLAIGVGLGLWL